MLVTLVFPVPRPGRFAHGDGGGKGGAAIAERRRRRSCGRRHHVNDYRPRGRLYPAYWPACPPRAFLPAQRDGIARLDTRNALATSPGFSALRDVRRPDDGPRTDLAGWRRGSPVGAAPLRGASCNPLSRQPNSPGLDTGWQPSKVAGFPIHTPRPCQGCHSYWPSFRPVGMREGASVTWRAGQRWLNG